MPKSEAAWAKLVADFESGQLPWASWRHAQHVAVCVWYVHHEGLAATRQKLPGRIRAFNAAHGVATTPTRGYHETLTQCWLSLTEAARLALPRAAGPMVQLQAIVEALADPKLPWRHHSAELLASPEARATWLPADLLPLPALEEA